MNLSGVVTVLMPVYNAEKYLKEAIESILNQTYKEFDFLIIDDGSTDGSETIINSYKDSRIIFLKNERNMGIVKTLNKGLSLIDSEYICRMDSDDIAVPKRLEKQLLYMENHPEVTVAGSSIEKFNDQGAKKVLKVRTDPKRLKTHLLFDNALMHPTVIMRNSVLKRHDLSYDENHIAMEDYGLWQKVSLVSELGNLDEVLLNYRENEEGISQLAKKDVERRDLAYVNVYSHYFDLLGIALEERDITLYRQFISGKGKLEDSIWVIQLSNVLNKILGTLSKETFDFHYLRIKWGQIFRINAVNSDISLKRARAIHTEHLEKKFPFQKIEMIKLLIQKM